jgi:hypothetical protein
VTDPTPPAVIRTPWHQHELFRWGVSLAVGFLLSWLASHGITPAPLPTPAPGVLVLNVSPTPAPAPISVTGGK